MITFTQMACNEKIMNTLRSANLEIARFSFQSFLYMIYVNLKNLIYPLCEYSLQIKIKSQ